MDGTEEAEIRRYHWLVTIYLKRHIHHMKSFQVAHNWFRTSSECFDVSILCDDNENLLLTSTTVASPQEKDINDVFNDILLSEDKIYEESYKEGYLKGILEGSIEGYHLGYHRGAELGAELGYYFTIAENFLSDPTKEYSEKIKTNLENIVKSIIDFPRENAADLDLFSEADRIRSSFKKICALLRIDAFYPEVDNLSF